MQINQRDIRLAKQKKKREWIKTQWKEVEDIAKHNGVCYSTWYKRLPKETPIQAASYPPCPYKGRKVRKTK